MGSRSQSHAALGRAVRDFRNGQGISQEDLAHRSGMHRTYLGGIERGERNVSYANLKRLARALDVPASQLLARAEEHEDGRGAS
ncbi:MAG TPA: helix-turn-helix transcriptional regulator [Solirubrobacteraceae bacterium]